MRLAALRLTGVDAGRAGAENIFAAAACALGKNRRFDFVSSMRRCEKITAAGQVKRFHGLVIPNEEFCISCVPMHLHESLDRRLE
jgi:hypothetical protein